MKIEIKKSWKMAFGFIFFLITASATLNVQCGKDSQKPTIEALYPFFVGTTIATFGSFALGFIQRYCDEKKVFANVWLLDETISLCGYSSVLAPCVLTQENAGPLPILTVITAELGYLWGRFGNPFCKTKQ